MLIGMRNAMLAGGGSQPSGGYWGLCFTAEEPNCVVNMGKAGTPPAVTLETSPDGVTWTAFDADGGTTPITLAAVGDKVYFRAGSGGNVKFASNTSAYRAFTLSSRCSASGDISSILSNDTPNFELTSNNSFVFCYLFRNCDNLITPPSLPSTTLADSCYRQTFRGCSNLISTPELPAQILAPSCYYGMFQGCTNLTSTPYLPAITLVDSCYRQMFQACSSISSLRVNFAAFIGTLTNWVYHVAETGTFYCPTALGTNDTITRGANYCPTGWTVVNTDA